MHLSDDSEIDLTFWRETDGRRVWYEWAAETFSMDSDSRIRRDVSVLHNAGGRSSNMLM